MPETDSLKHPQQFYLTPLFPQIVFIPIGNVLPMWDSHIGTNSIS
ncbi:hypothetical protein CRE00_26975 [Escherichia coli]|nr:hypothetical protein CRE00_26975 [Escherichia coli]